MRTRSVIPVSRPAALILLASLVLSGVTLLSGSAKACDPYDDYPCDCGPYDRTYDPSCDPCYNNPDCYGDPGCDPSECQPGYCGYDDCPDECGYEDCYPPDDPEGGDMAPPPVLDHPLPTTHTVQQHDYQVANGELMWTVNIEQRPGSVDVARHATDVANVGVRTTPGAGDPAGWANAFVATTSTSTRPVECPAPEGAPLATGEAQKGFVEPPGGSQAFLVAGALPGETVTVDRSTETAPGAPPTAASARLLYVDQGGACWIASSGDSQGFAPVTAALTFPLAPTSVPTDATGALSGTYIVEFQAWNLVFPQDFTVGRDTWQPNVSTP